MRRRLGLILWVVLPAWTLGGEGPAPAAEDLLAALGVQRPTGPLPAPDLALPSLDGPAVRLKDLRGKVVFLGFFTTT
jgi:hypothetical protein